MIRLIPTLVAATLIAFSATPATAADSAAEVRREFNQTISALKEYSAEQRDEFARDAEAALEDMERRINELEDRIDKSYDNVRDETREKWKQTLRELRKKRSDLAVWYGSVRESSAQAWPRVKKGFGDAFEDIADAYHDAVDSFESKPDKKGK